MNTHEDNFEFAVSQAVDGVLGDPDRHALAGRLDGPEARRLADEHAAVNALLRRHAATPAVDYDALAAAFARTLAAEDAYAPAPLPLRTPWVRLAVAAAVALTALAAWPFLSAPRGRPPAGPTAVSDIRGPTVAVPTTAPVTVIAVGPSDALEKQGLRNGLAAGPTKAVPRVVISAVETNTESRPY